VLGIAACESFGERASSSPPADGGADPADAALATDASATPDAANAPETGSARPQTCAQRNGGFLLCEDFESPGVGAPWTPFLTNGGQVDVADDALRGSKVLRASLVSSSAQDGGSALINRAVGPWNPPYHVRFFAFFDSSVTGADFHIPIMLSGIELGITNGKFLLNQHEGFIIYESMQNPLPLQRWLCVEWDLLPTQSRVRIDGKDVIVADDPGTSIGANGFFSVGLTVNAPFNGNRAAVLDDILVSSTPVGCN
jgi:hypothetical protein